METQTTLKNKMNGQKKNVMGSFKDLGKMEKDFEANAKKTLSTEKQMLSGLLENVSDVSSYLKSNWKKLLPLAVVTIAGVTLFGKKTFRN